MTPAASLALFRSEMKDAVAPYLWSDPEVYTYIDDAQKMFCRLTDGISDATTTAVVNVAMPAAGEWIALHPAILKIRTAHRAFDGRQVVLVNHEDLDRRGLRFDGRTCTRAELLVTGMEENKARLYPIPSNDDTLLLTVFRLPIATLSGAQDEVFEIGEQHHYHLLTWAKSRALLKQDAETFDKSKSGELEAAFRAYCHQAQKEQEKKRHKGARTVSYGGLDMGHYGGMNTNHYGRPY